MRETSATCCGGVSWWGVVEGRAVCDDSPLEVRLCGNRLRRVVVGCRGWVLCRGLRCAITHHLRCDCAGIVCDVLW